MCATDSGNIFGTPRVIIDNLLRAADIFPTSKNRPAVRTVFDSSSAARNENYQLLNFARIIKRQIEKYQSMQMRFFARRLNKTYAK